MDEADSDTPEPNLMWTTKTVFPDFGKAVFFYTQLYELSKRDWVYPVEDLFCLSKEWLKSDFDWKGGKWLIEIYINGKL